MAQKPALVLLLAVILLPACAAKEETYTVSIDPADFVETIDNPYFPLNPGTTYIYEGQTEDGFEHIEVFVTPETRTVMGVKCTVVLDQVWVDGELVEETYDWYAQDREGNVWYFGEEVKNYANGEFVNTAGAWEAGTDGALPGIIMPAAAEVGMIYRQEYYKGEAEDMAEVLRLGEEITIGLGRYGELLVTKEWTPLEPGFVENKYYAPGIGMIQEIVVQGGEERIELVEIIGP